MTIISRNYPVDLPVGKDFPKCVCGGEFQVQDNFNKRKEFHGTTAVCKSCDEYFVDEDYNRLKKRLPECQELRKKCNSSYKASDI